MGRPSAFQVKGVDLHTGHKSQPTTFQRQLAGIFSLTMNHSRSPKTILPPITRDCDKIRNRYNMYELTPRTSHLTVATIDKSLQSLSTQPLQHESPKQKKKHSYLRRKLDYKSSAKLTNKRITPSAQLNGNICDVPVLHSRPIRTGLQTYPMDINGRDFYDNPGLNIFQDDEKPPKNTSHINSRTHPDGATSLNNDSSNCDTPTSFDQPLANRIDYNDVYY